ncbi:hypothetical protein PENTCL1PPCAC_24214, partial [Pristionchus entomophagus]
MNAARDKANRSAKRNVIVIDVDESTSDQPCAKKDSESVSSKRVIELEEELRKSKGDFQRACLAARKAELRAEAAEERLDCKYGIKENYEAEKKRADELEKKLAEISAKEVSGGAECNVNSDLAQENEALKKEMAEIREEHRVKEQNLTIKRAEDVLQVLDNQAENSARINELTDKLANYEGDLFQMLCPDSSHTISYELASKKLRSVAMGNEGEKLNHKLNLCFTRMPQLNSLVLYCRKCDATLHKTDIILHFLSKCHE